MPSAVKYIPPTDPARNAFRLEVEQERRMRRNKYREALEYYLGQQDEQLAVDRDDGEAAIDDNVIINLVQMTADRTVSFLFPELPRIETDPASVEDTEEELWLRGVLMHNGGLHTFVKWGLRGFLAGHSFLRVKPARRASAGKVNYPTITVLDPTSVSVYWRADDVADVLWYEMRYMVGNVPYIQDFVKVDDAEWRIYTYKSGAGNSDNFPGMETSHGALNVSYLDLMTFGSNGMVFEQEGQPAIHRSEIPPIIEVAHLPHPDDYYGLGEFTQKTLQDTINRIAAIQNRLVRENAAPVDVMTGADPEDVAPAEGGLLVVSNPTARVNRLELRGDLAGIRATLDKLIETYLAVARVVLLKGEAKDLQRVTNASVRTLFLDMLSKNSLLQSAYGEAIRKMAQLLLEMAFADGKIKNSPEGLDIKVHFPTPLPVDASEIANQNAIMVGLGARSLRTAATEMGNDWNFELAAMDTEAERADERKLREGDIAAENMQKMAAANPQTPQENGSKK